ALADATSRAGSGRERVEFGFRAYFEWAVSNSAAFKLLLGTSLRSDQEFGRITEEILDAASETISVLIDIPGPADQRSVLATALVGMAEAVGRRTLQDENTTRDAEQLASWISELVWFGLRGVGTHAID